MNDILQMRIEFEATYPNLCGMWSFERYDDGDYKEENTDNAWRVWQAAKKFDHGSTPFVQEVKRIEDMSAVGYLKVMRDGDGDVIVVICAADGDKLKASQSIEFCVGRGGNRSPNTVKALIQLAAAMQKDNLENPIRSQL